MTTWSAVQARLLRAVGLDQIEEIDYNHHQFIRYSHVVNGPPSDPVTMGRNDLNELAAELAATIKARPAGVDLPGLEAFLELIHKSLPKNT